MRNALCSRGGRLLELLRTASMDAQRKTSLSESGTQCLTKRAPGEDSHDPTGRRRAARANAARRMVPRHELLQMHGTHRYPAGLRSVLRQRFASALLLAVIAGAHAALVAALLLHRQAFRTPPEVLPTTIAVSLVSPPQSTPPPVSAPVPAAPPPPEPAVAEESAPAPKPKPTKLKPRSPRTVRPSEPPPPAPAIATATETSPAAPIAPATPPAPAAPTASPLAGPPSTTTASPTPPRFSADYLRNPAPAYPRLSRERGEEGQVKLRVQVSADGRPEQVEIEVSSRYERLDEAARKAVLRWHFVPAQLGEKPVSAWVIVPITFKLKG
jgi:periplasmic protein TonB